MRTLAVSNPPRTARRAPQARQAIRAFTTTELLVSSFVGLVGTAMVASGFIGLQGSLAGQRGLAGSLTGARRAMGVVTKQLLQVGAGLPSGSIQPITEASATRLVYHANPRGVATTLSTAATAGVQTLAVRSTAGFLPGDEAYVVWGDTAEKVILSSVTSGTLELQGGLGFNYPAGAAVQLTGTVTLEHTGDALVRNGKVIVPNVQAAAFTYDSVEAALVRQVTVALTVRTPEIDPLTRQHRLVTLKAQVSPPNLNLDN